MFTVEEYTGADGHPLRYGKLTRPEGGLERPLLFLPGLGGSVKGALAFLERLLPFYSPIYGPDLRGFGLNPLERPLFSTGIILKDLEAFHQQVMVARHGTMPFPLAGISLGAALSTLLAAEHPERYERLVLLAPAYRGHSKAFSMKYQVLNAINRLRLGKKHVTNLPYGLEVLTTNPAILNDPSFRSEKPVDLTFDFLLDVKWLTGRALKATQQLRMPVMVIVPGQDLVCDPAAMRQGFAQMPAIEKRLIEYDDAYHDLLFETVHAEAADEVLGWVSKASASTEVPPPLPTHAE